MFFLQDVGGKLFGERAVDTGTGSTIRSYRMSNLEDRVIDFVAHHACARREQLTPDTTLFGDLGMDGQDGWEFMEDFGEEFDVDLSRFRADRHFGPEGLPVWAPLSWLFCLPFQLVRKPASPEERAGLQPIRIRDLINAAEQKSWPAIA